MTYLSTDKLLPGPFSLHLPEKLKYGKLLPDFLSVEEQTDYLSNLKKIPDWHYKTKKVSYNLNSENYRTREWDDIDWENSIAVFGCSHVFGEGIATDETLCFQLEQLTGRPVINLGQSGTSTLFSWHNSLQFDKNFKTPHAVIQVWSSYNRIPYYDKNEVKRVGFWSGGRWDNYNSDMKNLFDIWNRNEVNARVQFQFTAYASERFWSPKTKYAQLSFFENSAECLDIPYIKKVDEARDFIHSGVKTNLNAANTILEMIT